VDRFGTARKPQQGSTGARFLAFAPAMTRKFRRIPGRARSALATVPPQVVPERESLSGEVPPGIRYRAREHVRRDTGARIVLLDLEAPDAPPGAPEPFRDADGMWLRYAAECETHGQRKFFAAQGAACRAVKASHQWCASCKDAVIRHHKLAGSAAPRKR
jgi:hypothetical protein